VAATSDLAAADLVLTLGPHHPSSHGVLLLGLDVDGDRIAAAEPRIGHLHRGAEKLFEVRDYRQILMLANRHDWLGAFGSEVGAALVVERMLGLEPPPRSTWLRTLLCELNRVLSHLVFLGGYPGVSAEAQAASFADRERLLAVMEALTGGRVHFMAARVGGLAADLPEGWLDEAAAGVALVRAGLPALTAAVLASAELPAAGVGVLSPEAVLGYGVSGPIARASGVDRDLRRDEPYLAYGELADVLRVPTRGAGDCRARLECLAEQAAVSLDLVDACAERLRGLGPGPIATRLPKVLRLPEGQCYQATENPLGLNGYYLVSRGDKTPWRFKLRTASFNNVQALSALLVGQRLADLTGIVASTFFVLGDVDK
jgi:NADH-quinone oxidoreductase subunit D